MNSFQCGYHLTRYICSFEGQIFKMCNSTTIGQLFLLLPVKSFNVITDATCLTLHWHYLQQRKGKEFSLPLAIFPFFPGLGLERVEEKEK